MPPSPSDAAMLPLSQMVSAQHPGDADALAEALRRCGADDPAFTFAAGAEDGAFRIAAGTAEKLAQCLAALRAKATVTLAVGPVDIACCWAPARLAEAGHRLGEEGGAGDFAVVRLRIAPRRSGEGNVFESEFAGPPEIEALNAAVARGVARCWAAGVDGNGPIIDTRVVFVDGAFHASRSTPDAFEAAAVLAMEAACRIAGLRRLEPLMEAEILAERDLVLSVVDDVTKRGGSELRRRLASKGVVIVAELPLRNLLTYEADLDALTGGRGKLLGAPRLARWAEVRRR